MVVPDTNEDDPQTVPSIEAGEVEVDGVQVLGKDSVRVDVGRLPRAMPRAGE
jgi:hypothetical protein